MVFWWLGCFVLGGLCSVVVYDGYEFGFVGCVVWIVLWLVLVLWVWWILLCYMVGVGMFVDYVVVLCGYIYGWGGCMGMLVGSLWNVFLYFDCIGVCGYLVIG